MVMVITILSLTFYFFFSQIGTCDVCQKSGKKLNIDAPELHPVPVISPWHHIGIDFIGPISPPSVQGNKYIFTICDYFTKFVEAIPVRDKYASTVASNLLRYIMIVIVVIIIHLHRY